MSKINLKGLAAEVKNALNIGTDIPLVKSFSKDDKLTHIDSWIALKPFFKEVTGGEGFPCGHITQIIGEPDSGKTTLIMEAIISCQKAGGVAFLVDSEHKFDLNRLSKMGGIVDDLLVLQVENLEAAWDSIYKICNLAQTYRDKGLEAPLLLVWDSIAGSKPKLFEDSEAGDSHVSVQARINNKNVIRLRSLIKKTSLCFVGINHYYMTMPKSKYEQSKLAIKGGQELTFFSTLILKTKKGAKIEREVKGVKQKLGRVTRYEVEKGHFHGRTVVKDVYVVDSGILENDDQLAEYKKSIRGDL